MIAYAGPSKSMTPERLHSLVNLPSALLSHTLENDVATRTIPCLVDFLNQQWTESIYHPKFSHLLDDLTCALAEEISATGDFSGANVETKLALIESQDATVKFVADHALELPSYIKA